MSMEEESKKATEYWAQWKWNSKLQRMIYIPTIPEYYLPRESDEEPTFKEKAYAWFVRGTLFALLPFAVILIAVPVVIYGGAQTILEAKTFRGFWNDN